MRVPGPFDVMGSIKIPIIGEAARTMKRALALVALSTLLAPVSRAAINVDDAPRRFSVAISGRASPGRIDLDQNGDVTYTYDTDVELRIPVEKSFSRPHVLRANLFFNYPYGRSDTWWAKIIEGGSASLLYKFTSGQAFTYLTLTDPPDTYDNYRYPPIQTFDLRLEKMFNLSNTHAISVYALITNLFNTKNLRSYGDIFFDADATKNYVEKGEVSTVDGFGYDISYQTYYEPRRYYFGVRYSF